MTATVPGFEPVRVKPGDLAELAAVLWRVSPVELREGDGAKGARGKLGEAWRLLQDAAKVAALEAAAFEKAWEERGPGRKSEKPEDVRFREICERVRAGEVVGATGIRAEAVLFKAKGGKAKGGRIEQVTVTPFELARLAAEMNKAHLAGLREAWEVLQSAAVVEAEQMAAFHARAAALKDEREAFEAAGFGTDGDKVYFWEDLWPTLRELLKDGQKVTRKTRVALGLPLGASEAKTEDLLLVLIYENWTDDDWPVSERAAAARRELETLKSDYFNGYGAASFLDQVKKWRAERGGRNTKDGQEKGERKSQVAKRGARPLKK